MSFTVSFLNHTKHQTPDKSGQVVKKTHSLFNKYNKNTRKNKLSFLKPFFLSYSNIRVLNFIKISQNNVNQY